MVREYELNIYIHRAVAGCIFCYVYLLCLDLKIWFLTSHLKLGLITEYNNNNYYYYYYYYYYCYCYYCYCYYYYYKATSSANLFSNETGGFIVPFNMSPELV